MLRSTQLLSDTQATLFLLKIEHQQQDQRPKSLDSYWNSNK
jgi:hypothetical protein